MAEITTTERLPFPLAKPNSDTFVTQASEIGHGNGSVADTLQALENSLITTHEITSTVTSTATEATNHDLNGNELTPVSASYYENVFPISNGKSLSFVLGSTLFTNDQKCMVSAWNGNTFLGGLAGSTSYHTGDTVNYNIPSGTTTIRVSLGGITSIAVVSIEVVSKLDDIYDDIEDLSDTCDDIRGDMQNLEGDIDSLQDTLDNAINVDDGGTPMVYDERINKVINTDGTMADPPGAQYYSDVYTVTTGLRIKVTAGLIISNTQRAWISAWNGDTFVSCLYAGSSAVVANYSVEFVVPENCNKIIIISSTAIKYEKIPLKEYVDDALENVSTEPMPSLKGLVWNTLGSSSTEDVVAYYGSKGSYPMRIKTRNKMTGINSGKAGWCMAVDTNTGGADAQYSVVENWNNDPDIITFLIGANDIQRGGRITFNGIESTDLTDFYGAMKWSIEYCLEHFPKAKIGIMCPYVTNNTELFKEMRQANKIIAEYYGLPYLDLNNVGYAGYYANVDETHVPTAAINAKKALLTRNDGFHFNDAGMEILSKTIESFIASL